jgi:hypothetical protein
MLNTAFIQLRLFPSACEVMEKHLLKRGPVQDVLNHWKHTDYVTNFKCLSFSLSNGATARGEPRPPSRFRATIFQFLHPSRATSSSTQSSHRNLGLPLGRFPSGSLRRTPLDKSSSSWRMICAAHLSLLSLQNFTMSFSPHSW